MLTVVVTRGIVESVALCLVRTPGLRRLPRANVGPWIVGTVVVVVLAGLGQSLRTRGHHRVRTSTARSSAHQFKKSVQTVSAPLCEPRTRESNAANTFDVVDDRGVIPPGVAVEWSNATLRRPEFDGPPIRRARRPPLR